MKGQTERILNNSLTDLVAGVKVANLFTGGSDLASYATIGFNNNYSLLTLNRIILTYLYTSSGIIQTAIDLPTQDALAKGIEIESGEMSAEDVDKVLDYMEKSGQWEKLQHAWNWSRLYGGAGLILATNDDPVEALNYRTLSRTPIDFFDVDRWQFDNVMPYGGDIEDQFYGPEPDFYYIYGQRIHKSRIIRMRGKRAPYYVRRQLRGWGMSEAERMIPPLNLYMKTQNVLYEILDESKIDVYKIKGFAAKLLQKSGTETMTQRIQLANELKNYVNALIMDEQDDYEQKTMSFGGLAEISGENRLGIAAALRMPITKLFGLSASGFNTGESDLENYNLMIESDVRRPMRPVIRKMLEINMAHLFGYVPSFQIKFPSLRVLSAEQEETVKTSQMNRALALYDRGLINSREVGQLLRQDDVVNIETEAEKGLLPDQPPPPNGPESVSQFPGTALTNSLTYSGHKLQGRMKFQGLDISIENRRGSVREGVDDNGKPWKTKFAYPYGYIRGSVGTDGDHLDCYVGDAKNAKFAYVIAQNNPESGDYDEDKVMLGFKNQSQAVKAYRSHYNDPAFFGGVTKISVDDLKERIKKTKGKRIT